MRILVLNHNLRERGTYFRAREVARGFHERGHDVTFACTGQGYYRARSVERRERWHHWESANWSVLRDRGDGFSPLGMVQRLMSLHGQWDLVYTFSHTPVDQGVARILRGPSTFWMTDWCDLWSFSGGGLHDIRHWQRPLPSFVTGPRGALVRWSFLLEDQLEQRAARDADGVSIIASPMLSYAHRLHVPDERVLHLVSGADVEHVRTMEAAACREKLGLPRDRTIVGYVANATPDNTQLEEAMVRAWREFPDLLMISVGPRWYERGGAMDKARREGRLIDFDRRPYAEVPEYLGAADFLVMPLRDLPFNRCRWPHKFGDYLASGRATATCDVGDMGTITREADVGVAGAATPEGLAEAIVRLAGDGAGRMEMGIRARQYAVEQLSWNGQMEKLCGFLRDRGVSV